MQLYNRILKLVPSVDSKDFTLQDNSDGKGPFIAKWTSTEQQPTEADIASVDDSPSLAISAEEVQNNRRKSYQLESDALFFEEQRGEVSQGTWAAKVDEIKLRFPK